MKESDEGPHHQEYSVVVRQYDALIQKICRLYADTIEERRDLAQEIRLQLWRAWPGFAGHCKISTWIYQVALNTALTYRRGQGRRITTHPLDSLVDADSIGVDECKHEQHYALHRALERLEPGERALALLWLEACSYGEIAEICGISVNLVGVRIHRIRERLKRWLQGG